VLLRRHRRVVALTALTAAGVVAFVLAYFEPQKLIIDDRVSEPVPALGTPHGHGPAVRTVSSGAFRSFEHHTTGRARVIALADGRRYVRFEGFHTSNGPVLEVYLSEAPATGPGGAFDDRYVSLGGLKGNIGDQNYAIPRATRLARYRSVVVWCKRFGVPFAAAPL
jgi:Electron transfer DM13